VTVMADWEKYDQRQSSSDEPVAASLRQISPDESGLPEPEVQVAMLEGDDLTPGIPLLAPVTGGEEMASGIRPDPDRCSTDPLPDEKWAWTVQTAVPILLADIAGFRRVLTLTQVGDAAQCEISDRQDFSGRTVIPSDDFPLDIPIPAGRQLWLRHATGVDQLTSGHTEPRGVGR
jgi:hypothetical protein